MNRAIAFLRWLSIVVAVTALAYAFIVLSAFLLTAANGQVLVTNQHPTPFIQRRSAPAVVPPLPRMISRSVSTNDAGEKITVTVERNDPPPLPQPRYMTNVFEVMCTRCRVTAQRVPKRVEEHGFVSVPEGDELDLTLYFVCCSKEFRAKSKVFIETPVARLVR